MAAFKIVAVLFALVMALAAVNAAPGGWGGWSSGGHHKHVVIHVPEHIHTVHHHHVKKIHVPVPIYKKIYVHEAPKWNAGWW